jgi:excisionase family DNA binding protein
MQQPLLTPQEVADLLRVDVATVDQLVHSGRLPAYRIGDEYRFSTAGVDAFLAASATTRPPGRARRGQRYQALTELLSRAHDPIVTLRFGEINAAQEQAQARPLPDSAFTHRAWWANTATHSQASAWMDHGWLVKSVDLTGGCVTFQRAQRMDTAITNRITALEERS